jgi:hypothetical protein
MKTIGAIVIAAVCLMATQASAQLAQSGQPCMEEFGTLQKDREKHGTALKEAQPRKDRAELCGLLKSYSVTEAKVVKFMETNNVWCGIPPQAVTQIKTVYANTQKITKQVCSGGGGPSGPPPPPSLSDALGTTRVPDSTTTRTGRGTLDTLTGNPLGR